jgi:L-threonylcarbamoyladenylate synthase
MNADASDAIASLRSGGIAVLPTDTVYGLAVSPEFPDAVRRLGVMKGRPPERHYPVMVASPEDLPLLGIEVNEHAERLLRSEYVPGALTLVFGFRDQPTVPWLEGRVEVGVRIPDDERMLQILRGTGPLLVTSANKHGHPPGETVAEILAQLDVQPDLVIDGGTLHTVPSTLVNCRAQPPAIERVGCIPEDAILKLLDL